jgi:hypothetical protein
MSSKRGGNPCKEAAWWGRCCTGSRCSRETQESFGDLLQDDASLTPCDGIGGEAEEEQEPKTTVQPEGGAEYTAQYNNTHTQGGGYRGADRNVHQEVASTLKTVLSNLIQGGLEGATRRVEETNDGGDAPSGGGTRVEEVQEAYLLFLQEQIL